MKLIGSIILSLIVFLQSINLHVGDLLKFGDLMEHYEFHSKTYGDSFFRFLSKHYGGDQNQHKENNKKEKKDHDKLPFQHENHLLSASYCVLHSNTIHYEEGVLIVSKSTFSIEEQLKYQLFNNGVFQPPQKA